MDILRNLWDSLLLMETRELKILFVALVITCITSFFFLIRMLRYRNKSFLDNMIMLRELSWFLISARYIATVGFNISLANYSWMFWVFMAVASLLAYFASLREHLTGGSDVV